MAFTQVDALDRLPALTPQQDMLVQPLLDTALALAETYCNRKFMLDDETETLIPVYSGTLSLRRYPLVSVTSIGQAHGAGSVTTYHLDKDAGLVRVDGGIASHEVTVSYRGGFDLLPDDLLLALWQIFDSLWASTPGAGVAVSGTAGALDGVKSINVPDVGVVSFFDGGSGTGSGRGGAMGGAIPPLAAGILSLYRREIV